MLTASERSTVLSNASSGQGPEVASLLTDAGMPDAAKKVFDAWIAGSSGAALYMTALQAIGPAARFSSPVPALPPPPPPPVPPPTMPFGISDVIGIVTDIIPGTLDDRLADLALGAFGGSGSAGGTPGIGAQLPFFDPNPLAGDQSAIERAKALLSGLGLSGISVPSSPGPTNGTITAPVGSAQLGFTLAKPMQTSKLQAPPGYVIVALPPNAPEAVYALQNGYGFVAVKDGREVVKFAMRRADAIKRRYWRPQPKPPITRADMRAINRANAAQRRVAKTARRAGVKCTLPRK
jgi:hypothetical protein